MKSPFAGEMPHQVTDRPYPRQRVTGLGMAGGLPAEPTLAGGLVTTATDVIAQIREQAAALARRANPGCDCTAPWFAPKAAEVAEAMTRKLCLDLADQGRPDLARKLLIAWHISQQSCTSAEILRNK